MAQISVPINFPDGEQARVRDAFCVAQGYQATVNGSPNPETKVQFIQRRTKEWFKRQVQIGEAKTASESAGQIPIT